MNEDQLAKLSALEASYDPVTCLIRELGPSLEYVSLLLERATGDDTDRAAAITKALMAQQVDDPSSRYYGQFPWARGAQAGDLNTALFFMPSLIKTLELAEKRFPSDLFAAFDAAVKRAVVAAERRWDEERFDLIRDHKAYTNVFLLYIQSLLLAANHFEDERLQRKATAQWQRWFNHISYYGIDELSPDYSGIDYQALLTIHAESRNELVRRESADVLAYLSALYHAITHPLLKVPVCGSLRNYRAFLKHADCVPGFVGQDKDNRHAPAAVRRDYEQRSYPYAVQGRVAILPFRFQSWQAERAAMGTMTGGNYFWQQIHCMVAVGNNETERAVMFLPGIYTPTSGFAAQHELSALCVFCRAPNHLHRTQYAIPDQDVHAYLQQFSLGITGNWQTDVTGQTHLMLSAYGYDVHIHPFEIRDGDVHPIALNPIRHNDVGQPNFHRGAAEFDGFLFPAESVLFGCFIAVREAGTVPPAPAIQSSVRAGKLTVSAGEPKLTVELFQHRSGEWTECYTTDWRTLPLLDAPAFQLHPGDLTHKAANASTSRTCQD